MKKIEALIAKVSIIIFASILILNHCSSPQEGENLKEKDCSEYDFTDALQYTIRHQCQTMRGVNRLLWSFIYNDTLYSIRMYPYYDSNGYYLRNQIKITITEERRRENINHSSIAFIKAMIRKHGEKKGRLYIWRPSNSYFQWILIPNKEVIFETFATKQRWKR